VIKEELYNNLFFKARNPG